MSQSDFHTKEDSGSVRADFKPNSLTRFREDILAVLADESRYGLAIKREMREYYGEEITHSHVYGNLDKLANMGFAEKTPINKQSNEYSITPEGREWLRARTEWRANRLGYALEEER